MSALAQTWFLTTRLFRQLLRQPWWIAIGLAQPVIWRVSMGNCSNASSTSLASASFPTSRFWRKLKRVEIQGFKSFRASW